MRQAQRCSNQFAQTHTRLSQSIPQVITREYHARRLIPDVPLRAPDGRALLKHEQTHVIVCADANDISHELKTQLPEGYVCAYGIYTSAQDTPATQILYKLYPIAKKNYEGQDKNQNYCPLTDGPRGYPEDAKGSIPPLQNSQLDIRKS